MGMGKQAAVILGSVLAVVLAVVLGTVSDRMSAEVMAVVIGVVCGVAAGIPTSVLLLVVLTRSPKGTCEARERQAMGEAQRQAEYPERGYPPVVVIQRDPMEAESWLVQTPGETDGRFYVVERDDLLLGGG